MPTIQEALQQGISAHQAGDLAYACVVYVRIAQQAPDHPATVCALANLAAIQELQNQPEHALVSARAVMASKPDHPLAALVAARCHRRTGAFAKALVYLNRVKNEQQSAELVHEKARILDQMDRYEAAMDAFKRAHVLRRLEFDAVNRELLPRFLSRTRARFTSDWVDQWVERAPSSRPAPMFMVGFNRSGTTLLDRMLDSHTGVHVLEEAPAIDKARQALDGQDPDGLDTLDVETLNAARKAYFDVADARAPASFQGLLVDKLPLNTVALGLIHRLFPNAKVVFSIRHPADVVLSNFMQSYKPSPVTCHFDTIEGAAALYADVMSLGLQLRAVLPLTVLDVRYEDLVLNWEHEVRRLLDFAGLPWDDRIRGYLDRTQRQGVIGTPSYDQVIQPVHKGAVGRWRNYAHAIEPVTDVLAPFVNAFQYDTPSN